MSSETQSTPDAQSSLTSYLDRFQDLTGRLNKLTEGLPEAKAREIVAFFTEVHTEHTGLIRAVSALYTWSLQWGAQLLQAQIPMIDANRINMEAHAPFINLLAGELAVNANNFQGGEAEQLSVLRTSAFAVLGSLSGAAAGLNSVDKAIVPLRDSSEVFIQARRALEEALQRTGLWPLKSE